MDYKRFILSTLLTKFENSKHYLEVAAVNRRILLKFNRSEFPKYDIENWTVRDTINNAVKELKSQGIIDFEWKRYEEENIIESVWLVIEKLQEAYDILGIKPKADQVSQAVQRLETFRNMHTTSWILEFIDCSISEMEAKRKFTRYIPQDEEISELILKALQGLDDKGEEEVLERIFSRRYLGGSKIFEKKIRSRIITIIKDFMLKGEDLEDEEVLQQVGIIKTSDDILFQGPLSINLDENIIDFRSFTYGAFMNTHMIKNFSVKDLRISKVITIENKANYLDFVDKNKSDSTLVIYLAGFYSPTKRRFLQKIYDYIKYNHHEVEFYHWGDIDLGGFRIFGQLSNVINELQPMKMDIETLISNMDYCDKIEDKYSNELIKLKEDSKYKAFFRVIDYMMEEKVKLEQEACIK